MGFVQLAFSSVVRLEGMAGRPKYAAADPAAVMKPTMVVTSRPLVVFSSSVGD